MSNFGELVSPVEGLQVTRIVDEKKDFFVFSFICSCIHSRDNTRARVLLAPYWVLGWQQGRGPGAPGGGLRVYCRGQGTGECCAGVGRRDQA